MSDVEVIDTGLEGEFFIRGNDAPGDLLFAAGGGRLILRMKPDGTIEIGPEFTPTEAAQEFLEVLAQLYPRYLRPPDA